MKVVITGGGGFLGSQLARKLQDRGELTGPSGEPEPIDELVLFDAIFSGTIQQGWVGEATLLTRNITDRDAVFDAMVDADTIFHLASMVSGECEKKFDDALNVNLQGGLHVFESARARGPKTRVVFASSIAVFGGEAMQEPNTDFTKQTPQTTYGITKAACESLVNDYSRKGFFDGRSARLPTVIIRPGKPNAAASSWASGMFREPLAGEPCELPVHRDQCHPMTGYRTVIDSLVEIHEIHPENLGQDRALGLPAHRVTPAEAEYVVNAVAEEREIQPGLIVDAFDPEIQAIVDNWPTDVDGSRAVKLGLPHPPELKEIVRQYLDDFGGAEMA
ncbi:MAG: NAD-dependent epimerase/dehydratase family protein [Verrucomicrobiales bacterium]|nr:NAD-dependent epimerase/dehydratase family protein [Verrucomicrobiales bacterium]